MAWEVVEEELGDGKAMSYFLQYFLSSNSL